MEFNVSVNKGVAVISKICEMIGRTLDRPIERKRERRQCSGVVKW
jgi:hypothetical protein